MKNLINMIVNLAIEITTETEHNVCVDILGYIESVSCRVYIGGGETPEYLGIAISFNNEAALIEIIESLTKISDGTSELIAKPDPVYRAMQDAMQHSQH